mgnify:CR=1 FL=1
MGTAQTSRSISIVGDSTQLDSLSIVPWSFDIGALDSSQYQLDAAKALLIITDRSVRLPLETSITYETFPFNFSKPYRHKTTDLIQSPHKVYDPFRSQGGGEGGNALDFGNIEKSGSISRGFTVGSNQNLGVNSSLNLQLSGKLNERFSMVAAITDQNIPIQPEGNTEQLQDFDQVYIQIFDETHRITAGDFQIQKNEDYFMQFNKRLQGARIQSHFQQLGSDSTKTLKLEASGAVSRGKFARQTIQGIEGNQGPYRLTGAEGESFIIVLSGTERVYVDGRLLTRGQQNDYVINYNTSEIIFTANVLITKDRRIVVEYQYSDKNYARSLLYSGAQFTSRKVDIGLDIYSEQDAKNQPLQQDLTDEQKEVLRQVGDSLNQAVASSIDSVPFSDAQLLYNRIDTAYYDPVFDDTIAVKDVLVFSSNPKTAHFQAAFSEVGVGNGNYVLLEQLALGKVYQWVPPLGGVPQGNYEPVIKLVSPKKRQMVSTDIRYRITDNIVASLELAGSNYDLNTFSASGSSDDIGAGAKFNVEGKQKLGSNWFAKGGATYEYVQQTFQQIERFRSVEFDRDWNIRGLELSDDQHIIGAHFGTGYQSAFETDYTIQSFNVGKDFSGIQNAFSSDINTKRLRGNFDASLINQSGDLVQSQYYQHNSNAAIPFWKLEAGFKDDFENNELKDPEGDTLSLLAFKFWEWEAYLATADSLDNGMRVSYAQRTDWGKKANGFGKATFAEIYGYEMTIGSISNADLKLTTNYRQLKVLDTNLSAQQEENTLLTRLDYNFRLWRGALTSSSFYEVSSGLENKREYVFVETTIGQGTHIHIDYNENGEKELNEFEIAIQADQVASANYLKVFIPTSDYIKVFRNQFAQSLFLNPAAIWSSKKGVLKLISRFSDQLNVGADRKTLALPLASQLNPFEFNLNDSLLQSTGLSFRNTLYFNRSNPVFGADVNVQLAENRNLLTSGFESRANEKINAGFRWNFTSVLTLESRGEQGVKSSKSDAGALTSRNFNVVYESVEPKLVLQPGTIWRSSLSFRYAQMRNTNTSDATTGLGGESSISRKTNLDFTLNTPEKGNLFLNGSLIVISYYGSPDSPIGYELLEGLQPGINATWGISYQRRLANNLQINLTYNGRQSPGLRAIHTGGIEARAFF